MIIYKVTNLINNKVYIGQTIQTLNKRRYQHERAHTYPSKQKSLTVFDKAIAKYGLDNFKWEIIEECDNMEDLNERETYFIKEYKSLIDQNGYNLKTGGDNGFLTEEVKKKISQAQVGELNHMYGKTGAENHSSKPVINITSGKRYVSVTECAEKEGIHLSKVAAVCRGERGSHNNNIYRYLDKEGNIITPKIITKKKSKTVLNIDTGETFSSAADAERHCTGKTSGNLSKVCNGQRKTFAGYRWKYI